MTELTHIATTPAACASTPRKPVLWLQGVTLAWMLIELGVSVYAAIIAHSPALLAFGSDSLVELLSASVVLLQWTPSLRLSEQRAGRIAAALLFVLSFVIAAIALGSFVLKLKPHVSRAGIAITLAALAADAVQSATCAYLALITLTGLALNATFHLPWFDPLAALAAIPLLLREARSAWRGHACGCC
jgi:divalent metal cation (Fe/Co/Zn/Cd) transporter